MSKCDNCEKREACNLRSEFEGKENEIEQSVLKSINDLPKFRKSVNRLDIALQTIENIKKEFNILSNVFKDDENIEIEIGINGNENVFDVLLNRIKLDKSKLKEHIAYIESASMIMNRNWEEDNQ